MQPGAPAIIPAAPPTPAAAPARPSPGEHEGREEPSGEASLAASEDEAASDDAAEPNAEAPPPALELSEEPAREARPMGRVNVAATGGWADIYVRGRFVARTPHVLRLPAGTQIIELRPRGTGPPRRVTVDVRPGAATRLVVPLAPTATENPY